MIDHTKFKVAILSSIAEILPAVWQDTNYINAVNTRLCLAYDKNALYGLMRLLVYLVIVDSNGKNNPQLFNDAMQWYQEALPLLDELKIPKTALKYYNPTGLPNTQIDARNQALIEQRLKQIRDSLHSRQNKLAGQAFNSQLRGLLVNILTYFNSNSENALRLISQKVHILGVPQFGLALGVQGKIETNEAREALEEFVKRTGGKGLTLPQPKVLQLKTKSPDTYKEYNRLRAQFRNTLKLEIKRIVREHGDLIAADDLEEKLDAMDLPTDFIPKGFVGFYDEDCNMYNKNKVQFASNQSGGTMRMNPNYDESVQGQAWMASGQTPQMQNPAMYYSKNWVVGNRGERKFTKVGEILLTLKIFKNLGVKI